MADATWEAQLEELSRPCRRPDDSAYRSLAASAIAELVRRSGQPGYRVEAAALQRGVLPERYARNTQALSLAEQKRLLDACVCIVGVGGLGGTLTEILARIGVGRLRLVDGDVFEESNLNRQRFAHSGNLGRSKVSEARQAVAAINPSIAVAVFGTRLAASNAPELIGEADVVIDCLDRLDTRLILQAACHQTGRPLVSGAVAGSAGQLTVILPGDAGWEALLGDGADRAPRGVETRLGNLPYAVNLLASLEAAEAVKLILGRGGLLRNRLLVFDLQAPVFDIVALA
jgi:molybdopterin/thiamine biosynthesis adenylyltransferase